MECGGNGSADLYPATENRDTVVMVLPVCRQEADVRGAVSLRKMIKMTSLTRLTVAIQSWRHGNDEGASLVEYALLVPLIAIVAVVAITVFGGALSDQFDTIQSELP